MYALPRLFSFELIFDHIYFLSLRTQHHRQVNFLPVANNFNQQLHLRLE